MATDFSLILSSVAAIASIASLVRVSALQRSTDRVTESVRALYKDFSSFRASYNAAEDARAIWASRIEGKVDAPATEMYNKLNAAIVDIRGLTVGQQKANAQAEEMLKLARLAWESSQIATEAADKATGSIEEMKQQHAAERRKQR